ncbi:MAG: hypothetical protein DCC65_03955 [Planctomycetota bacterium]|nr:MAG: hypothetical protein DCC65_03955 [Planctomycetota bacterium]
MAHDPGPAEAIVDVRPAEAFERLHRAGSANIPLEELAARVYELPPRDVPLTVYDENRTRALWAASRLRARGRSVVCAAHGAEWLAAGPTERGPSRTRLWRPHRLLEEAVEIIRRPDGPGGAGPAGHPRALDIACGTGRDAVFMALSGFEVEAWDILPDALERCAALAGRCGVGVRTLLRDVERDPAIAPESWDLVCCFNFLHRPLLSTMAAALRPGGLVVYETFVDPQREVYGKPGRAAHVLRPGELAAVFAGLEILVGREGPAGPRRIAASLIARRRG